MNSAPSNPHNIKYFTIFCQTQFWDPQCGPSDSIKEGEGGLKKTLQAYRLQCDYDVKQKSAFQDTW